MSGHARLKTTCGARARRCAPSIAGWVMCGLGVSACCRVGCWLGKACTSAGTWLTVACEMNVLPPQGRHKEQTENGFKAPQNNFTYEGCGGWGPTVSSKTLPHRWHSGERRRMARWVNYGGGGRDSTDGRQRGGGMVSFPPQSRERRGRKKKKKGEKKGGRKKGGQEVVG